MSSIDQSIIKKYFKGECTPEELAQVKELIRNGEAKAPFEQVLNEGWSDKPEPEEEGDAEQLALWKEKFQQKIDQQEVDNNSQKQFSWLNIAAVFALFAIGAGIFIWMRSANNLTGAQVAMQEVVSPKGKLLKIKLSDSSVVTLNAASKLKFPASFNGKTREVYLEGEAFFDVAHDAAHPFIVHSSKVTVNVLGTSFDIKSYNNDQKISVAVATGKVGVIVNNKLSKTYFLLPGEKLAYNLVGETAQQVVLDPADVGSWQNGMLIYHNEKLEAICKQLERWYDINIVFKRSKAAQIRFNLKQKNDRLENVMQTLKFAGGIKYTISGKTVTIW